LTAVLVEGLKVESVKVEKLEETVMIQGSANRLLHEKVQGLYSENETIKADLEAIKVLLNMDERVER
jgi:hypothetical protein